MEIQNENKKKKFLKRFGAVSLACVLALGIALTIAFSIPKEPAEEVSTQVMNFGLPMNYAVVVKDYADDRLQHNESLKRWEIHLAVDLASDDAAVFSVYDGQVISVDDNTLDGGVVKIQHDNGFVSVYSSLDSTLNVKEGDTVTKGQEIGRAANTANFELKTGNHLHFTLLKDGLEVDPNNYLDLQNK